MLISFLLNILGFLISLYTLLLGKTFSFEIPWAIPYGSFSIEIDALSAFFLILIFFLSGLCTFYSQEYFAPFKHKKSLPFFWFCFTTLTLSMAMVVIARNALLFLIAWEIMALSSFFLVTFEYENEDVSQAGWLYLIATHLGTAFLIAFFIILGNSAGSFDFDAFKTISSLTPTLSGVLFLCALVGFGTKAGLIPFHVWLPEAHPAAPSPVSALMSGVMIKTGIYGLIRMITILPHPELWWSYVLIGMGSITGIGGILFALTQQDIKKLLAYSSVENIGIITLSLGLGMLGLTSNNPPLAIFGFLAALLHTLNHSFFKGLLFLGAGSILHQTHSKDMNSLGGLLKKMPITGYTFLIGSIAICGLPPLNGFIGEFLIYMGALKFGITTPSLGMASVTASVITIMSLTLMGGLAMACFTKIFGIVFLGQARSPITQNACDPHFWMTAPMILLAGLCIAIGLLPSVFMVPLIKVLEIIVTPFSVQNTVQNTLNDILPLLNTLSMMSGVLLGIILMGFILRYFLLRRQNVHATVTWDCGYALPSPKMQYTATSFVRPLVLLFEFLVGPQKLPAITEYFPKSILFHSRSIDFFKDKMYYFIFHLFDTALYYGRRFQYGRIQLYIFYILITLIALFIWQMGIHP